MAGLLDFYGDPAANMALAMGLLSGGNVGQAGLKGISAAQSVLDSNDERKRRNEVMQAQAENLRSEVAAREIAMQKQKALQDLIGRYTSGSSGQIQGGGGQVPQGGMSGLFNPETLAALKLNGVDLVDVAKLAKPEWQNVNGNLVNTNDPSFKGGFQPGMNASANGQLTMWQPDGKGGLVVGAPAGALDTYRAYQGAGEQVKNQNTLVPPDRIGRDGRPIFGTVDQLIQQTNRPTVSGDGYAGGNRDSANADSIRMMETELRNPNLSPGDRAAIGREIERLKIQSGTQVADGRMSNDPRRIDSNPFATQAELIKANKQAEADVVRSEGNVTKGSKASDLISGLERARELLAQNPTGSLGGSLIDKAAGMLGRTPSGAVPATQLEALSGWLVSNVPRMEGPQSNYDVENYKTMAGKVGDRTLPVEVRMAAVNEVERLQRKYAEQNKLPMNVGGATGDFGERPATPKNVPVPMKGMVRNGYKFKGGDPADPANWEKQ